MRRRFLFLSSFPTTCVSFAIRSVIAAITYIHCLNYSSRLPKCPFQHRGSHGHAPSDYLKKIVDKLILTFKTTEPDFVNQYFSDRNIIDQGSGSEELTTISISGKVTNASTTADMPGIEVSLQPVGSSEPPVIVITNTTGDYTHTFEDIPEGTEGEVVITIAPPGFVPIEETIPVVAGESYSQNYSLTPAP